MSVQNWFKGSHAVRVDHGEVTPGTDEDLDRALEASQRRSKLVDKVLGFDTIMGVGMSALVVTGAMYTAPLLDKVEGLDSATPSSVVAQVEQAHKHMGAQSKLLHSIAGSERVTIISQDDPNLKDVVGSLGSDLLPSYRPKSNVLSPYQSFSDTMADVALTNLKGVDVAERFFALKKMQDPIDKNNAHVINKGSESQHVCYAQLNAPEHYSINNGMSVKLKSDISRVKIAVHELAHCMDLNDFHHDPITVNGEQHSYEVLQGEAIADATAMLYLGSKTGGWDFYDNSTSFLREMSGDVGHSTKAFLDQIKEKVDVTELDNLSIKESFKLATEKYQELDFEASIESMNAMRTQKNLFELIMNGDESHLDISQNPKAQKYWKDNFDIDNNDAMRQHMHEYSEGVFKDYLNHLSFTGESTDEDYKSVITLAERISSVYGNDGLAKIAESSKDALAEGQPIHLADFAAELQYHDPNLASHDTFLQHNSAFTGAREALFETGGHKHGIAGYEWVTAEVSGFNPEEARQQFVEKHRDRNIEMDVDR